MATQITSGDFIGSEVEAVSIQESCEEEKSDSWLKDQDQEQPPIVVSFKCIYWTNIGPIFQHNANIGPL